MRHLPKSLHYLPDGTLGDLLLVIDMQNVYSKGQPWACAHTGEVVEKIEGLIDGQKVDNVILTQYLPADQPVGTWQTYNETYKEINETPWMSELIPAFQRYSEQYPVFVKHTYSSYENEEVKALLAQARRVLISGVVAECCVLFTLLAGIDQGDHMVYLKDACTGLDDEWEAMVEKIATYYAPVHTQVMTCQEYVASKKDIPQK